MSLESLQRIWISMLLSMLKASYRLVLRWRCIHLLRLHSFILGWWITALGGLDMVIVVADYSFIIVWVALVWASSWLKPKNFRISFILSCHCLGNFVITGWSVIVSRRVLVILRVKASISTACGHRWFWLKLWGVKLKLKNRHLAIFAPLIWITGVEHYLNSNL